MDFNLWTSGLPLEIEAGLLRKLNFLVDSSVHKLRWQEAENECVRRKVAFRTASPLFVQNSSAMPNLIYCFHVEWCTILTKKEFS